MVHAVKKEGFKGQRSVILPDYLIQEMQNDPICNSLYITDIGYYPKAKFHNRKRESGCSQYILIYCVEGEGWFSVDGQKSNITANQFFVIPANTAHSYGTKNINPWSIYWIHFSGKNAGYFYEPATKVQTISPSTISRIDDRIQLFEEMIQNLEMGYSKENLQYANVCLLHFLVSFKYVTQFRQIRTVLEKDNIENLITFMKENLKTKLTLKKLAEEAGISASHLSLIFRQRTGRSPIDYLQNLRIQRACQYLDNTQIKVSAIGQKVGFDDPFHFSRVFKTIMGNSPRDYRKQPKG